MKDIGQLNRVNYSLTKHHRQLMRDQIDPHLIEHIEIAQNPSLNYRNAFKTVYHDQLEKTIEYQQEKKQQAKNSFYASTNDNRLKPNPSSPTFNYQTSPLRNVTNNGSSYQLGQKAYKQMFTDYDEERNKKIQGFVNKSFDNGNSFFRAQDQYQKKKQQQSRFNSNALQLQLKQKEYKKMQDSQKYCREVVQLKQNHTRQIQLEQSRNQQKKHQKQVFGGEVKQQMEVERIKRGRRSYFQYSHVALHNPITNPIEYHIDNPYILQKYQQKANYYQ